MKTFTKLFLTLLLLGFAMNLNAQNKRALSIDDLWAMQRINSYDVSQDGKTIAFSVTVYDMDANKGSGAVYLINADGTNLRKFMNKDGLGEPVFTPSGKLSYTFKGNLYTANIDGSEEKQITDIYTGVSGVQWAKDGNSFLFASSVYPECATQECNKQKDEERESSKVKAEIFTELLYRHWNDWRGPKRSHLFHYDMLTNKFVDLNLYSDRDTPALALGSGNDYALSPDGKEAAYTMNKTKFPADNTNNDVFLVKLENLDPAKTPADKKVTPGEGNDNHPVYSPDGKYLAYFSMERPGFEADKERIFVIDRKTGEHKNLSGEFDNKIGQMLWSPDSKFIYFVAADEVYNSVYRLEVATSTIEKLSEKANISSIHLMPDGKTMYYLLQKSNMPKEIFKIDLDSKAITQVTSLNGNLLAEIKMNDIETFWSEGAEGAKVQSYIVKPPFFEEGKKYPVVFLIHGGPQGHWTDDFHYRWNAQMFASPGYVVVATNPRGSTGYGQDFTDGISQDWGGKVYTDLMNALDYALENYDYMDKNTVFAAGASYGGYMINWIEGHTDRFSALVCHAGVFNMESMYGATEELWFPEWEMGGTPWENPELYKKWSPHRYVANFKTPMLVIHGAYDFRVPESQAFELFTSLQKMGVESKFLYFPDEYHFVTKPQNAKLWWNTIYDWYKNHE